MIVRIDGRKIVDWESFHDVFAAALGFPAFYGRNMNAWIDCVGDCDAATGMTSVHVAPGDVLTIVVDDVAAMGRDQYAALVDCAAFVNWRRLEVGARAIVALAFNG